MRKGAFFFYANFKALVFRAANNGRSTDNVRSKIGFVRSNP